MATVPLGAGTLTIAVSGGTAEDFSCEVMNGTVTHGYNEIGESRTNLCGETTPSDKVRADGFSFHIENDLSTTGLYMFLMTNDLKTGTVVYTPNTAWGIIWEGDVQLTLPSAIGADEYGAMISSDVEWAAVGTIDFTPGTPPAARSAQADTAPANA